MKIKKIGTVFCLGVLSLIWATSGFSEQSFQFQRKTGTQNQSRQSQTQGSRIRGTQTPQQMQIRENTQAYTYKCRVDSANRGIPESYFIQYNVSMAQYITTHPNRPLEDRLIKPISIPLRCDATQPQGRSGWYMSIDFDTLDEAMSFFNFIQNKTLYGRGTPYGTQMEMLEFSSFYIGPQ
ncbi:MAG: hypothetical protein HYY62_09485 [Deltaproteobacteria bacterium]|nr:hypothetical protein [Deltaproteobacteria bacterium]